MKRCKIGWPRQEELKKDIKPYWVHQSELHIAKGLLMNVQRVVIREKMQTEMLTAVELEHSSQCGGWAHAVKLQKWLCNV